MLFRSDNGGRFLVNKSSTQTANAPLQVASTLGTGQIFVGNGSGTGYMFGRDNVTTGNFVLGELSNDSDTSVTNYLNIATGTGNATFIGKVGVGVVPTEELHIKASDPTIRLEDSDTAGLGSFISGESGNLLLQSYNANRDIIFGENAAGGEIMRVTGLGSVGIGTSAPGAELEIAGDYQPLIVNSTNSSGAKIVFEDNGTTRGYIGGASSMPITFYNSSAALLGGFDTNGRFSVGTSAPTAPLDVRGYVSNVGCIYANAGAASQYLMTLTDGVATNFSVVTNGSVLTLGSDAGSTQTAIKSSGAEAIRIDSSQRVGIGTQAPDSNHKLEVYGTGTTEVGIRSGNSSEAIINFGDVDSRLRGRIAYSNSAESMTFWANGGPHLYLNSSGHLGIGNSGPDSALTISKMSTKPTGDGNSYGVRLYPTNTGGCYLDAITGGTNTAHLKVRTYNGSGGSAYYHEWTFNDAGTFSTAGSVTVNGTLSKNSGSFKIDHPLPAKKDTHHLVHSFTESPQADLIYRGRATLVDGEVSVDIDDAAGMTSGTFEVLCRDVQCFTSNETGWTAVRGSVTGATLTIEAQDNSCTDTISWMVVGERKDPHMFDTDWTDDNGKVIVEPLKPVEEDE